MNACECGCGGTTKRQRSRFLPGHYSRTAAFRAVVATVDPERTKHVGPNNPNWKGGRRVDAQGYIVVRTGPATEEREHRVVAARVLGRALVAGEVVHHKNGNRQDNRPENLEVLASQADHMREHMTPEEARTRGAKGGWARRAALAAVGAEVPT